MPAKNKAVFLDRDGVLNKELGDYVCRVEDFVVLDNFAALKSLQDKGYLLIVATNQGGLAKGWYTEEELAKMHAHLRKLYLEHGVEFTDIFYCPHHPQFTGDCDCRKPKPGLLFTLIEPPINSINDLLIERPNPVPPYLRVMEESNCEKALNNLSSLSGSIPMPVVTAKNPM